jgi:hypothetical protein
MPSSGVAAYVARVRRYPKLSHAQARRLAGHVRASGDRKAAR